MANSSRYYWIKLRTDFFSQETIDFILSQKNGCEYIVLYQMLCLKTANSGGELSTAIGEMIVPYNVEKIVRDTKYFDFDTVSVALQLFKKLGLIYESDETGILRIANYDEMVGSESASPGAQRQKRFRDRKQKALQNVTDSVTDNVTESVTNCNEDIRYKILDNRDKILDIELDDSEDKSSHAPTKQKRFVKPTIEQIQAYCSERKNGINPQKFFDYYESNGWRIGGKAPMKDWKAAVRTWESNNYGSGRKPGLLESGDIDKYKEFINDF